MPKADFKMVIAVQVWALVLQPDHWYPWVLHLFTIVFFFLSHSSWVVHLHRAECKTGAQIYVPSALGHARQLLWKSITLSLRRAPTRKMPPYKFGIYNEILSFLNDLFLLICCCCCCCFSCTNIHCYIVWGRRCQFSLRHDKISRNTPLAVPHCFNIVLFNKKMTPSAWMTTPKWTINILYIRKSWELKYAT